MNATNRGGRRLVAAVVVIAGNDIYRNFHRGDGLACRRNHILGGMEGIEHIPGHNDKLRVPIPDQVCDRREGIDSLLPDEGTFVRVDTPERLS